MERRSIFVVKTAGKNFCPLPPALSRRVSLAAVDENGILVVIPVERMYRIKTKAEAKLEKV
jgi:hypothetical protein